MSHSAAVLFWQTYYLLHEEGFFVGASSGLNVAAAVKVCYPAGYFQLHTISIFKCAVIIWNIVSSGEVALTCFHIIGPLSGGVSVIKWVGHTQARRLMMIW